MRIIAITVSLFFCLTLGGSAQPADLQITTDPRVKVLPDRSVTIRWTTNIPARSWARYGTESNDLNRTANDVTENGTTHNVTLSNLRAGTTYYYQVVSSAAGIDAVTFVHRFTTRGKFVAYETRPSSPSLR